MKRYFLGFWIGFLLFGASVCSGQIVGQSSSQQSRESEYVPLTLRSFEIGGSQTRFTPSQGNDGATQFRLNRPTVSFLLRQDNSLLFFDYSSRNVDDRTVNLNAFGAKFDFEFFIAENYRQAFKPLIAISFIADLIQADAEGNASSDNPRLTSLSLGGGGGFNFSTRRMIFVAKAEAFIGFGTQGFSATAGSAKGYLLDVALQFPRLAGGYGVAFSYRLRYTISDYSQNQYDYLFNINSFTAGVTF